MKKTLFVCLAVLLIVSTMVSGSLAVYSTSEEITSGEISAKTMILELNKIDGFDTPLNIAPTESYTYDFNVTNTKGNAVSLVKVDATITVKVLAANGKQPIGNLTAVLYENGERLAEIELDGGVGELSLNKYFDLEAKTIDYTLVIEWVSGDDDMDYCGSDFGNVIIATASGVQCTHDSHDEPVEPEEPEQPEQPENPDVPATDIFVVDVVNSLFENRSDIFVTQKAFTILYRSAFENKIFYVYGDQTVRQSAQNLVSALAEYYQQLGEYDYLSIDCEQRNNDTLYITATYYEYKDGYTNVTQYQKGVDKHGRTVYENLFD